jgi:hypothetical protein
MTPVIVQPSEIDQPVRPLTTMENQGSVVAANRNFLTGTAITVPQGRVELTARSAILVNGVGIAAGLTSTTEIWADAYRVAGFDGGGASLYGAGLKQVLGRGDSWQLAATASIRGGSDGGDDERLATLGGVLTGCTENCGIMASVGMSVLMLEDEESLPVFTGGVSVGGPTIRLLTELMFVNENGEGDALGFVGLRFGSRKVNCDLGLAKAIEEDDMLPMIAVAGRI